MCEYNVETVKTECGRFMMGERAAAVEVEEGVFELVNGEIPRRASLARNDGGAIDGEGDL